MPDAFPLPLKPIPQGEHILVVDDTPAMANLIAGYLREAGYKVEIAHSAEEAWESLLRKLPILMTVDDFLPGIDGYEFCDRISNLTNQTYYWLARIMVADQGHLENDIIRRYELPLFAIILTKPFIPKMLLYFVWRILQD